MVNLKQIQLVGFKSFADKTVIPMTDGITCIVGPNGCGKSNVADAIRWVLGEQSAKTMRGSTMTDVIFNGTETRRKLSYCEVTLVFDNTNRIFDMDCAEVEMTRRLYRNGDSEYLLNRHDTRLKDMVALLHKAGAAKEGYSIIGQGRIQQIMNSRPEDRRAIFEEATGIIVFKDKKSEAERNLSASKDNLRIFQSRLDEVERQLAPLSKAAETAKKYNDYYFQLRHHEINAYIYRRDTAKSEREKLNDDIEGLKERRDELSSRYKEITDEQAKLAELDGASDRTLQSLNDKRLEFTIGVERGSASLSLFAEKANAAKEKLSKARDDFADVTNKVASLDNSIKRENYYLEMNTKKLENAKAKREELKKQKEEISDKITEYNYATGQNRQKVLEAFKELSDLKENRGSLSAQKDLMAEKIEDIRRDMQKIQDEKEAYLAEYNEQIDRQRELTAFLGDEDRLISEAEGVLNTANDKLETLKEQIQSTKEHLGRLEARHETQEALKEKFEGYMYSVRNLMTEAKTNTNLSSKISGLIADVVTCSSEHEIAIETAFGGAMQNIITQTREDAKDLIQYLKTRKMGQITCLPIEALRPRYESDQIRIAKHEKGAIGVAIELVQYEDKYENVIHYLLGNTLVCEDIGSATIIAGRYPRAFKIVTLDGDVVAQSGAMTGGSRKDDKGNLLGNERKIKEIEDKIKDCDSFLSRANVRQQSMQLAKDKAQEALDDLKKKINDARVELSGINAIQNQLMKEADGKENEYKAYRMSEQELLQRAKELDDRYISADEDANLLSRQNESASVEMEGLSGEKEKLDADLEAKTEELNAYNIDVATLEQAVKTANENITRFTKDKEDYKRELEALTKDIATFTEEAEKLSGEATSAALTEEEKRKLDLINEEIRKMKDTREHLKEQRDALDRERLENYNENEQLRDKLSDKERALQKIDDDLEHLRQRIEEEYNETYESCQSEKEENYDISQSAQIIANCKRQITLLGSVNPNAIAEFEELDARHETMLSERADITKGIDDLTKALEEITEEMLKIFNEGFEVINENFKRTFKELFGGGRAELKLDYVEGGDPLAAGVEIEACPPGKKLSKISLLSGGEQSLTAIAILFAIIQMRAMPFCLLDEIEAALDEANVGRYANFLKKFAQKTQFIVITHRKPTMEAADTLFGVTMEEKGVSKIVSVKLSEVEERLGGDTITVV